AAHRDDARAEGAEHLGRYAITRAVRAVEHDRQAREIERKAAPQERAVLALGAAIRHEVPDPRAAGEWRRVPARAAVLDLVLPRGGTLRALGRGVLHAG